MVGLIILCGGLLGVLATPHDPWNSQVGEKCRSLLENPQVSDQTWRQSLQVLLPRLEHALALDVASAWHLLASHGGDSERANWLLFCRRHDLDLPVPATEMGPEETLEWALAKWGSGDLESTARLLERAQIKYPQDVRFLDNQDWLDGYPRKGFRPGGNSRSVALGLVAVRMQTP